MHGSGGRAFQTEDSKGLKVGPSIMFSIRRRSVWLENKGQGREGVKSRGRQSRNHMRQGSQKRSLGLF